MKPHITVAICTWNRAPMLQRTLQSMVESVPQGLSWELLVVNNRCTDRTDEVLDRYRQRLPLRRFYEENQGKSHALNHAIRNARGELIFWTDDDVLVDLGCWVPAMLQAAREQPAAAFFGGPVVPHFDGQPPEWLVGGLEHVRPAFAAVDLGPDPRVIDHLRDAPFGANFVVRRSIQERYCYDARLGRVGDDEIRGEETAVIRGMLADGYSGYWVPSACVRHIIPPDRMTEDYIRRWYHGIGRTLAIMGIVADGRRSRGWQAWLRAISREARYRINRRCRPPGVWVKDMARASRRWGELEQLRTRSCDRRAA